MNWRHIRHGRAMMLLSRGILAFRIAIGVGALVLVISSFAAPIVQTVRGYPAGEGVYSRLSCICHQYPTRCFWVLGRPTALCARCTAAYVGVLVAALGLPLPRRWQWRFALGAGLLVLAAGDPVRQMLTHHESSMFARVSLGLMGGVGAFLFLFPYLGHSRKGATR